MLLLIQHIFIIFFEFFSIAFFDFCSFTLLSFYKTFDITLICCFFLYMYVFCFCCYIFCLYNTHTQIHAHNLIYLLLISEFITFNFANSISINSRIISIWCLSYFSIDALTLHTIWIHSPNERGDGNVNWGGSIKQIPLGSALAFVLAFVSECGY